MLVCSRIPCKAWSVVLLFCRDPHRIQVGKTSPEVREDPVAGTHVPNLLYVDVQNFKQVLQLVATGEHL